MAIMNNNDKRIRELHDMICEDGPHDLKREDAILLLENMFADMESDDYTVTVIMTNDELREELCCSGLIHDSDMGEITE